MPNFWRGVTAFAVLCGVVVGAFIAPVRAQEYPLTADSQYQPGVPKGEVAYFKFKNSRLYPGTERDCWIYVPKQYDAAKPTCVMIFQDGGGFQDTGGGFRVPIVFDNLINRGEMPVTIGVFVSPGVVPAQNDKTQLPRYNRSFEYDAVDDRYARFLLTEILPEVAKKYNLTSNPDGRAISGASSGGIASFVAAWERPDAFHRVLSFIGSFTDLRGGNGFPPLIRKTEPKPLRVFLQDGSNDQDIYSGSWPIGNNDVAAALKFAGYESEYVVGTRGHDGVQGAAILPDALRWLWKGYPAPIKPAGGDRQPVMSNTLIPGENWTPVEIPTTEIAMGIVAEPSGGLFLNDAKAIYRIAPDGKATLFSAKQPYAKLLCIGPDKRLYVARGNNVLTVDANGKESVFARNSAISAGVVTAAGAFYAVGSDGKVWRFENGKKRQVAQGDPRGSGAALFTPDQSLLMVAPPPAAGRFLVSYRVTADGDLDSGQDYHVLNQNFGASGADTYSMAADANGWLYAATSAGIQMLDQAGRVNGIILPPTAPGREPASSIAFAGTNREYLYSVAGGKLYRRKTKARGVFSCEPPIKPPGPRL